MDKSIAKQVSHISKVIAIFALLGQNRVKKTKGVTSCMPVTP
jgi:hypothetical protein